MILKHIKGLTVCVPLKRVSFSPVMSFGVFVGNFCKDGEVIIECSKDLEHSLKLLLDESLQMGKVLIPSEYFSQNWSFAFPILENLNQIGL